MKQLYLLTLLSFCFINVLIAQPPSCTTNASPVNGTTGVNPSPYVTLTWNPVPGAVSYDVYLNTKVPPKQLVGNSQSDQFQFYYADYSMTYYWYVVPKNADGNAMGCASTATSFTTSAAPLVIPNDDCSGATSLTSAVINGSTLGATQSLPAASCEGYTGTADDDVWYGFTATENGTATVTLDGSGSFDGVLQIFSGSCGSLLSMACSDSSQGGGREQISLNVTAGIDYKIRVYSYGSLVSNRGNFTISGSGSPLPVSLLGFRGIHSGNNNILTWSTANELNNSGFEIQYSFDGTNFNKLDFQSSRAQNGNSGIVLTYQFIHKNIPDGNLYYRLVQIDKDGNRKMSNIILIKGEKIQNLAVSMLYPNPAKSAVKIVLSSPINHSVQIVITDLAGKKVFQQGYSVIAGANQLELNVAKLPAGSYFMKAVCKDGCTSVVKKFVNE